MTDSSSVNEPAALEQCMSIIALSLFLSTKLD